jgi:hypothetical protein
MIVICSLFMALLVFADPTRASSPAVAYPIPPRPLRLLVSEAEFVVTAHVRADPRPPPPGGFAADAVLLYIDEALKGHPGEKTIRQLNYLMICPAPARYVPNTVVLAFLDRDEDGRFSTHALSYGAKTLRKSDLDLYVTRVREQLDIAKIADEKERAAAQVEWLVKCAEHSATCWEGAYELAPDGDRCSDTHQYVSSFGCSNFARELTIGQRVRLLDAVLASDGEDAGVDCLELFRSKLPSELAAPVSERLRASCDDVSDPSRPMPSGERRVRLPAAQLFLVRCLGRCDERSEVRDLCVAWENQLFAPARDDAAIARKQRRLRGLLFELLQLY